MSEQNVVERLDKQIARTNVPYAAMGAMKAARAEITSSRLGGAALAAGALSYGAGMGIKHWVQAQQPGAAK